MIRFLTLLTIVSSNLFGQDGFIIEHYNVDNGLPQNTIEGICKDKYGFIWLGTQGGVCVWNGNEFKTYNSTSDGKQKINRIFALVKDDKSNDLLIIGQNNHIQIIKRLNFIIQSNLKHPRDIGINKNGLIKYRSDNDLKNLKQCHLDGGNSLFKISNGLINYFGNNILIYDIKNKINTKFNYNGLTKNNFFINDTLFILTNENKWLAVSNKKYDLKNLNLYIDKKPYHLSAKSNVKLAQYSNSLYAISIDGTYYKYTKSGSNLYLSFLFKTNNTDLNCCYYDEINKDEYYGTLNDGFYIKKNKYFKNVVNYPNKNNMVYSQLLLNNDSILYSNPNIDFKDLFDHNSTFFSNSNNKKKIPSPYISSTITKNKTIIGTRKNELYVFNNTNYEFKKAGKLDTYISSIETIDSSNILISTNSSLYTFNLTSSLIKLKSKELSNIIGLINVLKYINKDSLLIGTNNGLYCYSLNNNKLKKLPLPNSTMVRNIKTDTFGKEVFILIGTYGSGIYVLYKNKFMSLPLDKKQNLKYAHCFALDKKNRFWISSNNGLYTFNKYDLYNYLNDTNKSIYYYTFTKQDGFLSNEFNGGCQPNFVIKRNGTFSFSNMIGLVQFNPDTIKIRRISNPILIEKILIDNNDIACLSNNIILKPSQKNISIKINQAYIGNTLNSTKSYKLNEIDKTFISLPEDGIIKYNNLSPGEYELVVKNDSENSNILILKITIEKAWHQTIIFYVCVVICFLLIVFSYSKFRNKRLMKKKEQLEAIIYKKTEELNITISDLRNSNYKNEVLLSVLAHDIRSPLQFITEINDFIIKEWHSLKDEDKIKYQYENAKNLNAIWKYMNDIVSWIKIEKSNQINYQEFNFEKLSYQLQEYFSVLENHSNCLSIYNNIKTKNSIYVSQKIIEIIVNNLISNSNKYTMNGNINVVFFLESPNYFCCTCEDNGSGMDELTINDVTNGEFKISPNYDNSYRLGYMIIQELLRLLNGKLFIISKPKLGTAITIKIPINK